MKVVIKDEFDFDVKPSMIWLIIAILTNEYIDNNEYEMSFLILKGSSFQQGEFEDMVFKRVKEMSK